MARTWHTSSADNKRGVYWIIRSRRDGKKQNLSLGYVTRDEAQRAAERMTLEESPGRGRDDP